MSTTAPRRAAIAGQIAGGSNLPFAKADIVLDAVPTPVEIDHALARLEMAAREHGSAVGYRQRAAGHDRAHRRLGQGGGAARLRAGADQHGGGEGEVEREVSFRKRATGMTSDALLYESLPYRPCAGMTVLNRAGLVFIGRRTSGPEHIDATHVWQMPQGGIDDGRGPLQGRAARAVRGNQYPLGREARRDRRLARLRHPARASSARPGAANTAGRSRNGTRCASPATTARSTSPRRRGGHEPEFIDWRWVEMEHAARPGGAVQAADL